MKFQIGDLVVLKHTGAEGKIVGIENEEMFLVSIDGVDIPVFKENIDHPYFDWFTSDKFKKKSLKNKSLEEMIPEKKSSSHYWTKGMYLAFFPIFQENQDDTIEKFKIYLINQDTPTLYFKYNALLHHQSLFSIKSQVLPYTNFYIHDLTMDEMHEIPKFELHLEFEDEDKKKVRGDLELKIRPKKLFQYLTQLTNSEIAYISIPIERELLQNAENFPKEISLTFQNPLQQSIQNKKRISEIDLHIEKLISDYEHLSNAEIIQIQLKHFEDALQYAITMNQDTLTVIHGVGKGVLKEEIHNTLRMYKEVRHFVSDWMPKYGNGATQIFFYT